MYNSQFKHIYIYCILIFCVVFFTRLFFIADIAFHWDSVNFSYGIINYSIMEHSPQPPGYIGYILLGKLFYPFIKNPHFILVLISMIMGSVSVVLLYIISKCFVEDKTARLGMYLFMTGPLLWSYSVVAMSYTPSMTIAMIFILTGVLGIKTQRQKWFYLSGIFYSILGSFRLTDMIFMFPLAVYFLIHVKSKHRYYISIITILISIIWFYYMLWLTGGIEIYWNLLFDQFFYSAWQKSPVIHPRLDLIPIISKILVGTFWLSPGMFIIVLLALIMRKYRRNMPKNLILLITLGICPLYAFLFIVHIGEFGYLLLGAPFLFLGSIYLAQDLIENKMWFRMLIGSLVVIQCFIFVDGKSLSKDNQEYAPKDFHTELFNYYTGDGIRYHADKLERSYRYLGSSYQPDETLIFLSLLNSKYDSSRQLIYYLLKFTSNVWGVYPAEQTYEILSRWKDHDILFKKDIPGEIRYIILWSRELFDKNLNQEEYPAFNIDIPGGKTIQVIYILSPTEVLLSKEGFILLKK